MDIQKIIPRNRSVGAERKIFMLTYPNYPEWPQKGNPWCSSQIIRKISIAFKVVKDKPSYAD